MAGFKHKYWGEQIDAIARELSKLAMVCDINLGSPGLAERILKNDDSVCDRKDAKAFRQIRQHLMALFPLEERAIERLGADATKDILDQVRAAITELRSAHGSSQSVPSGQP